MDEAKQLVEHNGKKKRAAEYDANRYQEHKDVIAVRYQTGKDAIAAIEAKQELDRSVDEAEQLVENNEEKKRKKKAMAKDHQERKQKYSVGTNTADEHANKFADIYSCRQSLI